MDAELNLSMGGLCAGLYRSKDMEIECEFRRSCPTHNRMLAQSAIDYRRRSVLAEYGYTSFYLTATILLSMHKACQEFYRAYIWTLATLYNDFMQLCNDVYILRLFDNIFMFPVPVYRPGRLVVRVQLSCHDVSKIWACRALIHRKPSSVTVAVYADSVAHDIARGGLWTGTDV